MILGNWKISSRHINAGEHVAAAENALRSSSDLLPTAVTVVTPFGLSSSRLPISNFNQWLHEVHQTGTIIKLTKPFRQHAEVRNKFIQKCAIYS